MGKTKLIKSEKTGRYGLTSDEGKTVEVLPENARLMQGKSGKWGLTSDNGQTVEVLDDFDDASIDSSLIVENPFLQKKKEQEVAPSESLDGQSLVQKDQDNHTEITNPQAEIEKLKSEPRGISDYYSQTFSDVDPNIGKYFKSLENIQNNPNEKNIDVVKNITSHQKSYEEFTNKVVGRYNPVTDSYEYTQPGYKPKEGDIVGGTEKVGGSNFLQLKDGKWQKVEPPDPSFGYGESEPVTVTAYKNLQKPEYVKGIEKIGKSIFGEDFKIPINQSLSDDEWQKEVDQLKPLSQEYALYHKDNDKDLLIPKFLNSHPEIKENLEQELSRTPTQLESTQGREGVLRKTIERTYRMNDQPVNPFEVHDQSEFIDAPAFSKNLNVLISDYKKLGDLKNRLDLIKNNPKYREDAIKLQGELNKLNTEVQPVLEFFQQPNNKRTIDRLESNEKLLALQRKGSDILGSITQFFPKQKAQERKKSEEDYEANRNISTLSKKEILDRFEKMHFAPVQAAWGAAKKAFLNIGGGAVQDIGIPLAADLIESISGNKLNASASKREFGSAVDELRNNIQSENNVPKLETTGPNGELLIGNSIQNFVTDLGAMTGDLSTLFVGGGGRIANGLTMAMQSFFQKKDEAKKDGFSSDAEASLYALPHAAIMGAIGYGLGSKFSKEIGEFSASTETVAKMLNPATREVGIREFMSQLNKSALKDILKSSAKGAIEMKVASVLDAINNSIWNKYRGDLEQLPTDIGSITDDIKNFMAFAIQQTAMSALAKTGISRKEKEKMHDYMALKAAQGNPKEVIEQLDALKEMPDADLESIEQAKDRVLSLNVKKFPEDTTPEQKVELAKQAQIIADATKGKEITDREYHGRYNEIISEAQEEIDNILKNPEQVNKKVQEEIKPVVEKINKQIDPTETMHPIGEVGHNDVVFNDKKVKEENKNIDEQGNQTSKPVDPEIVGGDKEEISKQTDATKLVEEEINKNKQVSEQEGVVDKEKNAVESSGKKGIYIQKPPIKPPKEGENLFEGEEGSENKKEFDKLTTNIPNNGEVSKYLSGDTIRKYEKDDPRNDQEIIVQELKPALEHGTKIVERSKELFGDKYVEKTLDYLDSEKLAPANKALIYVSLENELAKEKLNNPDKVAKINKLQDLVRTKSQAFLRSSSLAINMGRLRKFAEAGYDISKVTDRFFSTEELRKKSDIEKAIQSDADTINKEEEVKAEQDASLDIELENKIAKGVEKEIEKIYQALPKTRKITADRAIAALERIQKKLRGKLYDAGLGVPVAIIDAGITTIKHAIKAGVAIADAVELGINKIKEKYGKKWDKEEEFRSDFISGFKKEGIDNKSTSKLVKDALIDAGFNKNINIKGEKKQILDWKKLAGEEGSIDKIKENVEKSLKDSGYNDDQIAEMQEELVGEYNSLRASVIEKSLNELAKRNKETITPEQKTAAKKLAELYNYGLFDQKQEEFDNLINKAIGASVSKEGFEEANKIAKAMQQLYASSFNGVKLNDITAKTAIQQLENRMRILLSKEANKEGTNAYKIASIAKSYMDISQTMVLNSLKQAVENPLSGAQQNAIESISGLISKDFVGSKVLDKQRRKMMQSVYKDMILNAGVEYGDVGSAFANRGKIDDYLNKLSDQKLYHGIVSGLTGKATLDGMDAMYKLSLTEKKFAKNLIKILTHETNKNRMSKEDAVKFVSEQLTGQTLEDAKKTATEIIEKINKDAGDNLLPSNKEAVDRLANDIVKSALEMGGKITSEQIIAAYKAAYKAAGLGLGHEANNPISKMVGNVSAKIQKDTNDAIKEKDWNKAALLTTVSTIWRNILTPFVGGGTNWLVLKLEKNGLGLFTGLGYNIKDAKDKRIDLSSEEGSKKLEDALYKQARIKDNYMRGIVGGSAALLTYLAFLGITSTEDYRNWRNRNKWAAKYLDLITPEFLLADMANKNGSVKQYLENVFNKNDAFDSSIKAIKAIEYFSKGNPNKGWGALGESLGGKFNLALPWRVVKDAQILYQGITGQDPYHGNYKPSTGFLNGVFKGGAIEWFGIRPKGEDIPSSYDEKDKNNPLFKKFLDKEIPLPEFSSNEIEIEDKKSNSIKKLSDFDKNKIEEFSKTRKKYIESELKRIGNSVYVDNYGRPSINFEGGKKRVKLDDLTKDQLKNVLSIVSSIATKQAKKEVFYK